MAAYRQVTINIHKKPGLLAIEAEANRATLHIVATGADRWASAGSGNTSAPRTFELQLLDAPPDEDQQSEKSTKY